MRSRWYHKPLLHTAASGLPKEATWLELFYDLVFVAAFIQLGNGLASDISFRGALAFAGAFAPLWVAWSGFTFFANRFALDDFVHRAATLAQMLAVGAMAIAAPGMVLGDVVPFCFATGAAFLIVALMHLRTHRQEPSSRSYSRFWGLVFTASGLGWLSAAFLPVGIAIVVMVLSTVGLLLMPLSPQSRELADRLPIDFKHLGERYGLLTIIVLGESFVKVLTMLTENESGLSLYFEGGITLLIISGLWWIYFDDVAGADLREGPLTWVMWLYAHLPLQLALTATGVAISQAVQFGWDEPAPERCRWLLAGSVALVLVSVALIDSVTKRRQAELSDRARVNARWISAVVVLVLAPAGGALSGTMFLALVASIVVAQVVFDMMMAPFEESPELEAGAISVAEQARTQATKFTGPRRDVSQAVRKGTPSELRRDLYVYFIEGGWLRVFGSLSFIFVLANVFFACLYLLEPGSISNGRPRSFADAFFFSVQTMSSIGYGGLTPATPYANAIVTAEAAVSIIGIAVVTGLVFAKVARPRASVLFSNTVVVTRLGEKRILSFRVGNARGNDVVDATIDVTVLRDEVTPEGNHLRRLHDLKLVRSRTPLFAVTWTVMHELDDDSPLADVDWDDPESIPAIFVATMVGHDSTYGQTVHARKNYYPENIRPHARFVDVLSTLPDGRLMIDYSVFHDTVPLDPVPLDPVPLDVPDSPPISEREPSSEA